MRISFNAEGSLLDAPLHGHNRFHPDIPPIARVAPGELIEADAWDGLDGQVPAGNPSDQLAVDMSRPHPLTGPFFVERASPGDYLEIHIHEVVPATVGVTCVFPGEGLLGARLSETYVATWEIQDGTATSPMVPGVAIPGRPFIGLIGVAPSPHRLRRILERERRVVDAGGIAMLPEGLNAVPSSARVAAEGLRTIAPRETGGNMDIRHLGAGSRLILPVDVPGALLSFGDIHFAQGDGESCGTAIEVAGKVSLSCEVRKRSDLGWAPTYPSYQFVEAPAPAPRAFMATTGIPLSPDGENRYFDVYLAAQEALHEMIEHLVGDRGYSRAQAYVLVSVAADLSISSIVNEPNPVVSAILPLDIFLD